MNYNHLMIFLAVAEAGGISRGAERLFISQPAVSKQLGLLEASLGLTLLERTPKGTVLTEAGRVLRDYARRLSGLERETETAMAELRGVERGTLTLGASLTVGAYLLPPLLAEYARRYPKITLSLQIANTETIQARLREGALDLALTEGFANDPELTAEVFAHDALVAVAPPGHPLLAESPILAARFVQEPLILREPGSGTRAVVEQAFRERGLTALPRLSLGSIEAIKGAVAAGAGLAMVSRLAVSLELETGRLALLPLSDLTLRRPLHCLMRRAVPPARALAAFLALLPGAEQPGRP